MFFDSRKTFDSVDHCILVKKTMEYCGFHGIAPGLLVSYLTNRTNVVRVNECISYPLDVNSWYSTSTVLDPL